MSKKITDKDGNVYVQKSPVYKKWWFWLLVALFVFYIIGSNVPDERDATANESTATETESIADVESSPAEEIESAAESSSETQELEQLEFYSVGDQVVFSDSVSGDEIIITFNSVSLDSGDEYNVPTGDHYVKVDATFENNGTSEYLANAADFSIYDGAGSKGDVSSKEFILEDIAAGKNYTGPIYFDVSGPGPYEVQIYGTTWVLNP